MAATAPRHAQFVFSGDEWVSLTEQVDAPLPGDFCLQWADKLSADERYRRREEAMRALADRGLAEPDSDRGGVVAPAVRDFVRLFSQAAISIGLHAWNAEHTVLQAAVCSQGAVSQLRRRQRIDGDGRPLDLDAVELTACGLESLSSELLRPLRDLELPQASGSRPGATTQSLTDTLGLIEAYRTGDAEVVRRALERVGPADAVGDVAFGLRAGYIVTLADSDRGQHQMWAWVHGDRGWARLEVTLPNTTEATDAAEQSQVRLTPVSTAQMTAQLTLISVALAKGGTRG